MLRLHLQNNFKMVKNKRDLKSPGRNRSLLGTRPRSRQSITGKSAAGGNIRVVIRVRPFSERENCSNHKNVIKIVDEHALVFDPKEDEEPFFYHGVQQRNRDIMKRANKHLNFTFDHVFGDSTNNEDVFEVSTKTLIGNLMKGYNCSVFVYGATGAGKTHTMLGCNTDPGITFLTMLELFKQKEELHEEREFEIGMTYLEVYNETVQDLLNPGPALSLREDNKYGVVVAGIKMHRIEASDTLFELLEQGNRNRTQHPTDANAESSRSHAVFQVYVKMKFKTTGEVRVAKLSMIDLAGSERGAATGYSGARFTEGANINKSLLALGNCINSLADGHRHVPYRDSKLTRLLKDSLGGNCQTVMIANISPSSHNYEDTYNTLKYAMRAKKIKSTIKKNVVNCESNLNHYIQLVEQLNKEIKELKVKLSEKVCSCGQGAVNDQVTHNTTVTVSANCDTKIREELVALYSKRKEYELQALQFEGVKEMIGHRKQLKQDTDARLSGFCTDSAEKTKSRIRITNTLNRLDRQVGNVQGDITTCRKRNDSLNSKIANLLEQNPELKAVAEIEEERIEHIRAMNKAEHLQKVIDLQNGELRIRDHLIAQLSDVLKPCFMQLRGHGFATEGLMSKYNELKRNLQGIRTVSWSDDYFPDADYGVSSTTVEDSVAGAKRKYSEETELDNTFTLPPKKSTADGAMNTTKVLDTLSVSSNDVVVADATYAYLPIDDEPLEDEVFDKQTVQLDANKNTRNVCAEGMMLKVTKPKLIKSPLLNKNQNSGQKTAKRLLTHAPGRSPLTVGSRVSPRLHKENRIPHTTKSAISVRKLSDKNVNIKSKLSAHSTYTSTSRK
ncbi:kinesin-like protein KIF18A [Photinus pyralis]|uniref:kinesin-like protein KIF18A n=1 Tax=Photinus pyralis TaxID=7054 RepID=UPI0012670D52|nr:kinesin-like protein KIF18A [Photinus pyralis]